MPDFYASGEYDLAGFIVGEVAYPSLAARDIEPGDCLIALASNGLHTNGYSFVRKLMFDRMGLSVDDAFPGSDTSVADVLLRTHRSYLSILSASLEVERIQALAHITGGGIPGNLSRVLGGELDAVVQSDSWPRPHEFAVIAESSRAPEEELFQTFNMGVGMIAIARPNDADAAVREIEEAGCDAFLCGEIVHGSGAVRMESA